MRKVLTGTKTTVHYMKTVSWILKNPYIWSLSQKIFGDDRQKMELYRSVFPNKGKVLDFGCSNGNTFPAFSDFEYTGFDNDSVMINDAKRKYKNYKNANFVLIDILKQKSHIKNFDFILFGLTGHHIDDKNLLAIFSKLSLLLKKGGKIYYFDSIRDKKKDSLLLTIILNLDQGKFIRTINKYNKIKSLLPKKLKMRKSKIYQVTGTLMPQPKYIFWELEKI